jgi:hypothetical protein
MLTRQGNDDATTSEERTMRHALVPIHLINQARPATPAQALTDAPPDEPRSRRTRRRVAAASRRLATRARRTRPA